MASMAASLGDEAEAPRLRDGGDATLTREERRAARKARQEKRRSSLLLDAEALAEALAVEAGKEPAPAAAAAAPASTRPTREQDRTSGV